MRRSRFVFGGMRSLAGAKERILMRALLVVDIQPDAMVSRSAESLIGAANAIIAGYDPENVIYISNLKPFASEPSGNPFVENLNVVSNKVFFKRRSDAFSNPRLVEELARMDVDEVEIIGIDGNWCIKGTALGAIKHGLKTTVNTKAVVSKNASVFEKKTRAKLAAAGVVLL